MKVYCKEKTSLLQRREFFLKKEFIPLFKNTKISDQTLKHVTITTGLRAIK